MKVVEPNALVKVTGYRGEPRNRVVRVVDVRDINSKPLYTESVKRNAIERSRYLITVHDMNENVFRSYYHSFMTWEPMGTISRLFWRISQWLDKTNFPESMLFPA